MKIEKSFLKNRTLTVSLTSEMFDEITKVSLKLKMHKSEFVRKLIEENLKKEHYMKQSIKKTVGTAVLGLALLGLNQTPTGTITYGASAQAGIPTFDWGNLLQKLIEQALRTEPELYELYDLSGASTMIQEAILDEQTGIQTDIFNANTGNRKLDQFLNNTVEKAIREGKLPTNIKQLAKDSLKASLAEAAKQTKEKGADGLYNIGTVDEVRKDQEAKNILRGDQALELYQNAKEGSKTVDSLVNEIANTDDAKAIAELNARIQAESVATQNKLLQAQALKVQQDSEQAQAELDKKKAEQNMYKKARANW